MRRYLTLLLLTCPTLCLAAPGVPEPDQKQGACVYARSAATVAERAGEEAPQARPAVPPVARTTPRQATSGGGGGDASDAVVPRARSGRWHSFLPGMFR